MADLFKNFGAYRADPERRSGGKEPIETMPTKYDPAMVAQLARAAARLPEFGGKPIPPNVIANMLLVEGRSDAGTDRYDTNKPHLNKMYKSLVGEGYHPKAAMFATAVAEKQAVADRLGIPFYEAWNGTGRSPETGKTGKDYNARIEAHQFAVQHPKNKPLLDLVTRAQNNALTLDEVKALNSMGVKGSLFSPAAPAPAAAPAGLGPRSAVAPDVAPVEQVASLPGAVDKSLLMRGGGRVRMI